MKRTFLSLIAAASLVTVAAIPLFTAHAEGGPNGRGGHRERIVTELNLSQEQQDQLQNLREQGRTEMEAILTPEQRETIAAAIANGDNPRQAMRDINLTDAQKDQMRALRESKRAQMENILTPDQQARFEEMRESHRGQGKGDRAERVAEALDLSEVQQNQIREIRENAQAQIRNVLTPDQQAVIEAAIANGENPRRAMRELDLTDAQKDQMRAIKDSTREQMANVLTPEQQAQFEEMRSSRRGQGRQN